MRSDHEQVFNFNDQDNVDDEIIDIQETTGETSVIL